MLLIDSTILNFIYDNCRTSWLDVLMPLITRLGDSGVIWIVLAFCLLVSRKYRKTGIALCCALVLDMIICNGILKPFVARIRPCDLNTSVQLADTTSHGFFFSFRTCSGIFRYSICAVFLPPKTMDTSTDSGVVHCLFTALSLCALPF